VWLLEWGVVNVCTGWWTSLSPSQLMPLPIVTYSRHTVEMHRYINLHHT
jgi:hypothetical protein